MRIVKATAIGAALVGLAAAPASAATVEGLWSMSANSSEVASSNGGATLSFEGGYSEVSGATGDAISFDWNGGPAFGTTNSSTDYNPGSAAFAVAVYLKADTVPTRGDYSPNVVQKGSFQSNGQWKMQLEPSSDGTIAACRFAGSDRQTGDLVTDESKTALDDGGWHRIVCWRESGRYGVTVDGHDTSVSGALGEIASSRPMRVGNKSSYAGIEDQFQGKIDCIAYAEGSSARATAESRVPC